MMIKWAVRIASPIGITAMLLALSACDTIGNPLEAMGGAIPAPDEFQVISHKPLVMPSAFDLPEPRPGAASPLSPDPHRDAIQALLGSNASAVVSAATPGVGERVLLSSANATSASSDIRVQLEQEKIDEKANKPYEAPSLFELFGGTSGEKLDESTLLDPEVEARRLQSEGKLTPVDPNATAEVETEAPSLVEPEYPTGLPQNKLKVEGTGPTY
jgi:hypothetical protein